MLLSIINFVFEQVKRIDANTFRQKLELFGPAVLAVDCRSFVCYNVSHVRGAVNLNVADRINRRRLQSGKVTLVELASSKDAKEALRRRGYREIVVYDDSTEDLSKVPHNHPLVLILASLVEDEREPSFLIGKSMATNLRIKIRIDYGFHICTEYRGFTKFKCLTGGNGWRLKYFTTYIKLVKLISVRMVNPYERFEHLINYNVHVLKQSKFLLTLYLN